MIQKRYQFYSKDGIVFTPWYNYSEHDDLLKEFQTKEKYQLRNPTLRNEFRVV